MSGFFLAFTVFLVSFSAFPEQQAALTQAAEHAEQPDTDSAIRVDPYPDRLTFWLLTRDGRLIPGTGLSWSSGEEIRLRCRITEERSTVFTTKRDAVLAILVYPPVDPGQVEIRLHSLLGEKRLEELRKNPRPAPDFDGPVWDLTALLAKPPVSENHASHEIHATSGKTDILILLNGDRMSGRILSIHQGFLRMRPEHWQERVVIPLRRVRTVVFADSDDNSAVDSSAKPAI